MLLMLVSLLCCVPAAKACLQCDHSIRKRHDAWIMNAPTAKSQADVAYLLTVAYNNYKEASKARLGVIDATTFYRVKTEYQNEFDRFLSMPLAGSYEFESILIWQKGTTILQRHLDKFVQHGLCPNQCGILKRRLLDCLSCQYTTRVCPSPDRRWLCATSQVSAPEGDQAVLNCFQPWHLLLMEKAEYHYSWSTYFPRRANTSRTLADTDFNVLVVTRDSSMILNQVHAKDEGTYRCILQGEGSPVFYRVDFRFAVTPVPDQTQRPVMTLPAVLLMESKPARSLAEPVVATITALSLAACAGLAVVLRMMMSQRRDEEERRRKRMEGTNIQNVVTFDL